MTRAQSRSSSLWGNIFVLIALLFSLHNSALCQRIFSLDDCLQVASQHNLSVQSTQNELRSTQLARQELSRSALPEVRFEGKALNDPHSSNFGYDAATTDGGQFSAQVGVQELLFDGGTRTFKSNQLGVDAERLNVEQRLARRDLRHNITLAFIDVLEAQGKLALQQQRVEELGSYLELVNRLYHGGGIGYTDVLKTQVDVENAKVGLQKSAQTYIVARISLAEAMGAPQDTAFDVTGSLVAPANSVVDSLLNLVAADSIHNLDLQAADFDVQRSLLEVDIVRTERLPSVSLTGDIGILSSGDNLRLPSSERVSALGYSIGISAENLLFNWGATDLRVQQRQLDAENVRLRYEQQRRGLVADAERVRSQTTSDLEQLNSIEQTLKVAADNYVLTKAQYAAGGASALEVITAEQLLADSRLAATQTRADLRRLLAKIEQLATH